MFGPVPSRRRFGRLLPPMYIAFAACVVIFAAPGCCGPSERVFAGATMGTTYTVKVVARGADSGVGAAEHEGAAITGQLDLVNRLMSTWSPDSELSRLNQHTEPTPLKVSKETFEVLRMAQQVSEASGGAFDVTVGPLVNAWGFGPEHDYPEGPPDDELAQLRERVGYHMLELDEAALTVRKARPDVYCDLAAIAKGYAVDRVAAALDALGCTDYMVEVGGEVKARGRNGRGVPWQIGIEKPDSAQRAVMKPIPLENLAVATSGDYRNYYEKDGVRLSHTIDPRTGRPIAHRLASVSVIHEACAMADAYATALMVLGPDAGYEWACKEHLAAMFIVREESGGFADRETPEFSAITEGAAE